MHTDPECEKKVKWIEDNERRELIKFVANYPNEMIEYMIRGYEELVWVVARSFTRSDQVISCHGKAIESMYREQVHNSYLDYVEGEKKVKCHPRCETCNDTGVVNEPEQDCRCVDERGL